MGYHPRIESRELSSFLTTRTRCSELWFINNPRLESAILGYAAKYKERYSVELYALAIEGNHIQGPALFPLENRSDFMRDFNSSVARAVPRYTDNYPGGGLWARRYSAEFLPAADDIEEYFFYSVLQPVKDGLVERISDYPGYNCFHDAVHGIKRRYSVVRWGEYNAARRYCPNVSVKEFTEIVVLEYTRLPGYEDLSQQEYASLMNKKLEKRRSEIVKKRLAKGLTFLGREALLEMSIGTRPKNTKTSTKSSHRPRILCVCPKRRAIYLAWYFQVYFEYQLASEQYRAGVLNAIFPKGTYRPFLSPSQSP